MSPLEPRSCPGFGPTGFRRRSPPARRSRSSIDLPRHLRDFADANAYLRAMTQYITVAPDDRVEAPNGTIKLHGPEAFAGMRRAGRLAASILDALAPHVVPGVSTQELDAIVFRLRPEAGGVPATLGYRGYTKSCCISINHVVCHGIPGERALKDGD